jgi:hypothetical protein
VQPAKDNFSAAGGFFCVILSETLALCAVYAKSATLFGAPPKQKVISTDEKLLVLAMSLGLLSGYGVCTYISKYKHNTFILSELTSTMQHTHTTSAAQPATGEMQKRLGWRPHG